VKLTIPFREASDTVFNLGHWPKADVPLKIGDVGVSRLDVTG
jgi:hypothetical protein